jgi:HlyD family secretion protein
MATVRNGAPSFFARHRFWLIAAAISVAVILLAAFNSMKGDIVPVRGAHVMHGSIRSVISTNGKIEPLNNFEAHAPVPTTVKRVLAKEGDHVKRGQLLLQLDDAEARTSAARALAQLKAAQADIHAVERGGTQEEVLTTDAQLVKARADRDNAKRNFEALQQLQKNKAASTGEVREAEAQYRTAEANVSLLEQKKKSRFAKPDIEKVQSQQSEAQAAYAAAQDVLSKSNVRAPFDGVVYSIPVRPGTFVNAGDLMLQMADLSKVRVRAYVDEPDVGRLAPNQTVEVTWDAIPGRKWRGTLSSIPASVKLYGTRNVGEITTQLNNSDYKLLPNINVTVLVVTAEHPNALIVPREAVRVDEGQSYVYRVSGDELHRQPVQTSIFNLTQVEITKGLSENETVALNAVNNKPLREGQPVKVVQ